MLQYIIYLSHIYNFRTVFCLMFLTSDSEPESFTIKGNYANNKTSLYMTFSDNLHYSIYCIFLLYPN